jgi:hypothetical protein
MAPNTSATVMSGCPEDDTRAGDLCGGGVIPSVSSPNQGRRVLPRPSASKSRRPAFRCGVVNDRDHTRHPTRAAPDAGASPRYPQTADAVLVATVLRELAFRVWSFDQDRLGRHGPRRRGPRVLAEDHQHALPLAIFPEQHIVVAARNLGVASRTPVLERALRKMGSPPHELATGSSEAGRCVETTGTNTVTRETTAPGGETRCRRRQSTPASARCRARWQRRR